MLQVEDYVCVDSSVGGFEFGFVLSEKEGNPVIKIVAVDHEGYKVRVIGNEYAIDDAYGVIGESIQRGFHLKDFTFTGIPEYILPSFGINEIV